MPVRELAFVDEQAGGRPVGDHLFHDLVERNRAVGEVPPR